MADYEVSKLMWMAIAISLAASIFIIAKPQIQTQAQGALEKVEEVVKGIKLPGDTEGDKPSTNPDDYETVANYAINGTFAMDKDGNAVLWATDDSKAIEVIGGTMANVSGENGVAEKTVANQKMRSLTIVSPMRITGDAMMFFGNNPKLEYIKGLENVNVSEVTGMSNMFADDSMLKSIDISTWDTSNTTNMISMFATGISAQKSALSDIKLGDKFTTAKVTSFNTMFAGASNLVSIPEEKLDFSSLIPGQNTVSTMFANTGIEHLDFTNSKFPAEFNAISWLSTMPKLKTVKLGQPVKFSNVDMLFSGDGISSNTDQLESIDFTGSDLSMIPDEGRQSLFTTNMSKLKEFKMPYNVGIAKNLAEHKFVSQDIIDGYKA